MKSRVAHIKKISISRLELTAATLAVKVDTMLQRELEIEIRDSIFQTDSTSDLCYINNKDRKFQTFVANRMSLIPDGTYPKQWRYIECRVNPDSDPSWGMAVNEFLKNVHWSKGPEILWEGD